MSEIVIDSLYKKHKPGLFKKPIEAVSGLSLKVPKGTVYGLVGPNGAGKSTTIRMLLNLIRPDKGEVRIGNKSVSAAANADFLQAVGYLPENPYLYDHLTLRELLRFAGRACGMTADQITARIEVLTRQTGIAYALKRRLHTFSKGMRQRAGLCFALLHDPELVILDEPMSGLDPLGRKMVCDLILDLKQQGKTVFFCSHILSDTERLCDKIAILDQGRLVREFETADLRAFRADERSLEDEFVAAVGEVH
ncbi:MAG: ABC transporter ATP-binding protein [Desulfuromonadaceae bacterium]|nr:ABC transporter ATP-binding protein [Desulfuromonadaceae bacterium]